jgi:hypothetical protein
VETETGWQEYLAEVPDLDMAQRALIREQTIRQVMAETGESREIATQTLDAMISMDREAVLDLMEGNVTTLRAGLERYVEELEGQVIPDDPHDEWSRTLTEVAGELSALLRYPWPIASAGPGQELEIRQPDDEQVQVWIGGREVASANYDEHGWSGMAAVQTTAENVHKALTSKD